MNGTMFPYHFEFTGEIISCRKFIPFIPFVPSTADYRVSFGRVCDCNFAHCDIFSIQKRSHGTNGTNGTMFPFNFEFPGEIISYRKFIPFIPFVP